MRKAIQAAALVASAVVLGLLVCELALRVAGKRYDASLYASDPVLGWTLRPFAEGWWVSEGNAYVRINGAGMHDVEYSVERPAGTLRIALLGDSMVAAVQVDREAHFGRAIEDRLSGCGLASDKVEAMNFGVPGYGTAQELLLLEERVARFSPDVVLLAFFPFNDVANNHRRLNPVNASLSPYFVLDDGALSLDNSFRDNLGTYMRLRDSFGNLANRSRVIQLAAEWLVRQRPRGGDTTHTQLVSVYGPPNSPEMAEAWKITESLIGRLRDASKQMGARFLMTSLTISLQHGPQAVRDEYAAPPVELDLDYPDRRLQALAEAESMPFLPLAPILTRRAEEAQLPISLSGGHYNELGHRMVGEALGDWLCGELAARPTTAPQAVQNR